MALIAGEEEFANASWQVKDLTSGQQAAIPQSDIVDHVRRILQAGP